MGFGIGGTSFDFVNYEKLKLKKSIAIILETKYLEIEIGHVTKTMFLQNKHPFYSSKNKKFVEFSPLG